MLVYFNRGAPIEVIADASPVGLGAVLVQEVGGERRAVCYASRSLSDTKRRYRQTEKEALALVWSCERFNSYLYGVPKFDLVTDHQALENHLWPYLEAIRANRTLGVAIATFQLQSSLYDLQGEHCRCSVPPN